MVSRSFDKLAMSKFSLMIERSRIGRGFCEARRCRTAQYKTGQIWTCPAILPYNFGACPARHSLPVPNLPTPPQELKLWPFFAPSAAADITRWLRATRPRSFARPTI